MTIKNMKSIDSAAELLFVGQDAVRIDDEGQLRDALGALISVQDGETVTLRRGPSHFVKATKIGNYWSATLQRGRFWTRHSFDAGSTTEFMERDVRRSRGSTSFLGRFTGFQSGIISISTGQIEAIMTAYFLGKEFPVPFAGA